MSQENKSQAIKVVRFIAITFAIGIGGRVLHAGIQYLDKKVLG